MGVCEFGEQLKGSFQQINGAFDQFPWYAFPRKTRRLLATLAILFAQQPVELQVFGSISCCRITLQNVSEWFLFHRQEIWCVHDKAFFYRFLGFQQCSFVFHGASTFWELILMCVSLLDHIETNNTAHFLIIWHTIGYSH